MSDKDEIDLLALKQKPLQLDTVENSKKADEDEDEDEDVVVVPPTYSVLDDAVELSAEDAAAAQREADTAFRLANPNSPIVRAANPLVGGE